MSEGMKVICVDDEVLLLNRLVRVCGEIDAFSEVRGFDKSREALAYVEGGGTPDVAFLDVDMPYLNGIELAKKIKEICPTAAIVFTTAFSQYALDAYNVPALGYLLKPIRKEAILKLLDQLALYRGAAREEKEKEKGKVKIRTFGNFEVLVGDRPIVFKRDKAREILAYIVDRMGTGATRPEIAAILWEDAPYDRTHQSNLNVYIGELKRALREAGAEDILLSLGGRFLIDVARVDCDIYRYLDGDPSLTDKYCGEYMSEYSWAEVTAGYLEVK